MGKFTNLPNEKYIWEDLTRKLNGKLNVGDFPLEEGNGANSVQQKTYNGDEKDKELQHCNAIGDNASAFGINTSAIGKASSAEGYDELNEIQEAWVDTDMNFENVKIELSPEDSKKIKITIPDVIIEFKVNQKLIINKNPENEYKIIAISAGGETITLDKDFDEKAESGFFALSIKNYIPKHFETVENSYPIEPDKLEIEYIVKTITNGYISNKSHEVNQKLIIEGQTYIVKKVSDNKKHIVLDRTPLFSDKKSLNVATYNLNKAYYKTKGGAIGDYSHTEGISTIALNEAEHASGRYNKSRKSDFPIDSTLWSVGCGTADEDRENAAEIRQNGDIHLNKNTFITGNTKIVGNTDINGDEINISAENDVNIEGHTSIIGDTDVLGNEINVTGDTNITGNTNISGDEINITGNKNVNINGDTNISGSVFKLKEKDIDLDTDNTSISMSDEDEKIDLRAKEVCINSGEINVPNQNYEKVEGAPQYKLNDCTGKPIKVVGIKVGDYQTPNEQIPVGTPLEEILDKILWKTIGVIQHAPTVTISNTGTSTDNIYEVGTIITPVLNHIYKDGSFEGADELYIDENTGKRYLINANCKEGITTYYKNDVTMGDGISTHNITLNEEDVKYNCKTTYEQSTATPINSKGKPCSENNIIEMGKAISDYIIYKGRYKYFLGYINKISDLTSDDIRNLDTKSGWIKNNENTVIVGGSSIKSDGNSIVIAVPDHYELKTITNGVGANIKVNFSTIENVKVSLQGSTTKDYTVYIYPITNNAEVEFKNVEIGKKN